MVKHTVTDEESAFKAAHSSFFSFSFRQHLKDKTWDMGSNSTCIDVDHLEERNRRAFHEVVNGVVP